MNKSWIIYLSILALVISKVPLKDHKSYSKSQNLPLLNAFATDTGVIHMRNKQILGFDGFNVDVDLSKGPPKRSDYFPFNAKMRLALYTSETLLVETGSCCSFQEFFCGNVWTGCKGNPNDRVNFSYVNFDGSGYQAKVSLSLDYNYWSLSSSATIATDCTNEIYQSTYYGTYGLVGMGVKGNAANNLKKTNIFSIYVDDEALTAQLHFKKDLNFTKGTEPAAVLNTTADWQLPNLHVIKVGHFDYTIYDYHLMFDMNTDSILFPYVMFDKVVYTCLKGYGVECPAGSFTEPTCQYHGEINLLPNISFYYGNQVINIPPQIYVKNGTNTSIQASITLKLTLSATYLKYSNHVSRAYYSHVVLGHTFMRHFYTVFDATSQTISLYDVNHPTSSSSEPKGFNFFYVLLVTVVILTLCYCKCWKKQKAKPNTRNLYSEEPLMIDEPELPRLTNDTVVVCFPIKKPGPIFPTVQEVPTNRPSYYAPNYHDYYPQAPVSQ